MDLALNRRSFFAALLTPFVARFLPKKASVPLIIGDFTFAQPSCFNTGLTGLKYYEIDRNRGNYMGIPRSIYPRIEAHMEGHARLFNNELDRLMMRPPRKHWTDPSRLPA